MPELMPELIKDQIFLDQTRGQETVQIMLEGDLIVPDTKPDMANILQTEEKVVIHKAEPSQDRVNYIGELQLSLMYLSKDSKKNVDALSLTRKVDDFINAEGLTPTSWVRAKAQIVNIDYREVNDRKVNYRAIVNITIVAEEKVSHQGVVHIDNMPDNQILKKEVAINRTMDYRADSFQVKEAFTLPQAKPPVLHVLNTTANIISQDTRITTGGVNISGVLHIATLYRPEDENTQIEIFETELNFSGSLDMPGATEDMLGDINLQIFDKNVATGLDEDGEERLLNVDITINAAMKIYSTDNLTLLDDAYVIDHKLDIQRVTVNHPKLVCINRTQSPVKDIATLTDNLPDMLQVFRVQGQVHVDDIQAMDDKIIVEGVVNTNLLYIAESDVTPLVNLRTIIPYRQVIEAAGTKPGMSINLDGGLDHIAFSMLSPREVELRLQLNFATSVTSVEETVIASDVAIHPIAPEDLMEQASVTIYIVQPGDSLWKIAKHYNTSLDEILTVNEIEVCTPLVPGQKLFLIK